MSLCWLMYSRNLLCDTEWQLINQQQNVVNILCLDVIVMNNISDVLVLSREAGRLRWDKCSLPVSC